MHYVFLICLKFHMTLNLHSKAPTCVEYIIISKYFYVTGVFNNFYSVNWLHIKSYIH